MSLVLVMSLFFPFSPQWVFPVASWRGESSSWFVVSFAGDAPEGLFRWLSESGCELGKMYVSPPWRGFPAGVAVRFGVRDKAIVEAIRSAAPKGGGGSLHPANKMIG